MDASDGKLAVFHGFVGFGFFGFVRCFGPEGFFLEAVGMELSTFTRLVSWILEEGKQGRMKGQTLTFVRASNMGSRTGILNIYSVDEAKNLGLGNKQLIFFCLSLFVGFIGE